MTDTTLDSEATFSARVRSATMAAHRAAERSSFVHRLMRGQLPILALADLMAQQHRIYTALEDTGRVLAEDPVVGPFIDPVLDRAGRLDADLAVLAGADWAARCAEREATASYAADIAACVGRPERYLAHHYTRLLGDLSGGQLIRRSLERHYGSAVNGALSFYDFSAVGDLDAYKDRYRSLLDSAPLSPAARAAMIDEVNRAYRHNGALFATLDAAYPA